MQFIGLKKQQDFIRDKLDQRISDVLSHGKSRAVHHGAGQTWLCSSLQIKS